MRVHLVGIGGSGMSGVARILLSRGDIVSGSDMKDSRAVLALRSMGAHIAIGHAAENLELSGELPDVVVISFAAIPQDNPELIAAKAYGIPIVRRSDLLADLMADHTQVLLAGTHGKTSTTSMTVVAMQAAGMDPSFAIGGQLNKAGTNAHHGTGQCFVAEADESDASLLRYSPDIAVVTNIEPDHLDFFKNADAYFKVFDDFADLVGDTLIVCLDDEHATALGERAAQRNIRVVGYGTRDHATIPNRAKVIDIAAERFGSRATFNVDGTIVQADVLVPGEHMVLNGAAALLAGHLAGGDVEKLAEGLSGFTGVRRRFEHRGTVNDIRVFDDYAHHPTEVEAVLRAARQKIEAEGRGRVVVVFQPHLYSRTAEFAEEFAAALSLADEAIVLDIFGAREHPVDGVTSRLITNAMTIPTTYVVDFSAAPAAVADIVQPGDIVLTMGAGNVTMLADEILNHVS